MYRPGPISAQAGWVLGGPSTWVTSQAERTQDWPRPSRQEDARVKPAGHAGITTCLLLAGLPQI